MENTRQQRIGRQIQRDMAEIFTREGAEIVRGSMVTVTAVRMSPDLGYARIYLSVFPFDRSDAVMQAVGSNVRLLRRELGRRIKDQLRTVPELQFFLDDSLEYIERIDRILKGE